MRLTITIDMDSAAFGEDDASRGFEVARILRTLSERAGARGVEVLAGGLRDLNGNTVGAATVAEPPTPEQEALTRAHDEAAQHLAEVMDEGGIKAPWAADARRVVQRWRDAGEAALRSLHGGR